MTALKWLNWLKKKPEKRRYHLTKDYLLSEGMDPLEVIDPLWWSVSIYDGEETYHAHLQPFTLPQRYVLAIQWYIFEVNNGGHDQFFFNSTGIVWKDALQGFRAIGHSRAAAVLQKAADKLGGDPPLDRTARQDLLGDDTLDFEECDKAFYEIGDWDEVLKDYIRAHADDFVFHGHVTTAV